MNDCIITKESLLSQQATLNVMIARIDEELEKGNNVLTDEDYVELEIDRENLLATKTILAQFENLAQALLKVGR